MHFSSVGNLTPPQIKRIIDELSEADAEAILNDWSCFARDEQLAPPGDWRTWLFLAGRGAGKTRSGAEWVRAAVKAGHGRIALIAPTAADARDVMVEGTSGIMSVSWHADRDHSGYHMGRPSYQPSNRRVSWANGALATLFSAEEPERLRGPQHDAIWADELAAWKDPQVVWDMAMFGLRLGSDPKVMVSTTPRPIPLVRALLRDPTTVVTRATTYANQANLAGAFLTQIVSKYEGTRLGRQELAGELLDDIPGALWSREEIDRNRKAKAPDLVRVVVAIDPSGTKGQSDDGDAIGIIVAAKGVDGRAYVLADRTCKLSPDGWGRRAVEAYRSFGADRVVAERNFGGAMVEHVIRAIDPRISYKEVTASKGKVQRAEPVAALYEQNRVSHIGPMGELEDQLCAFAPDGYLGDGSPDRADALVWALTELMLKQVAPIAQSRSYSVRR